MTESRCKKDGQGGELGVEIGKSLRSSREDGFKNVATLLELLSHLLGRVVLARFGDLDVDDGMGESDDDLQASPTVSMGHGSEVLSGRHTVLSASPILSLPSKLLMRYLVSTPTQAASRDWIWSPLRFWDCLRKGREGGRESSGQRARSALDIKSVQRTPVPLALAMSVSLPNTKLTVRGLGLKRTFCFSLEACE